MATIIPADYAIASFVLTGGGGTAPYVTTMGVSLLAYGGDDLTTAANHCFDVFEDAFISQISNEVAFDRVVLQVGNADGTSGSVESSRTPQAGGNSGVMAPLAMAPIGRKVTNVLGRKGRGRCFLPCMLNAADVNEYGDIIAGSYPSLNGKWQSFVTGLDTDGASTAATPAYLLHADGSAPTRVTGAALAPKVGWVRDRIR